MVLGFLSNLPVCLLTEAFSPFTFNVNSLLLCVNLILPIYFWLVALPFGWCNFFIALLVFIIWFFFFAVAVLVFPFCVYCFLQELLQGRAGSDKISQQLLVCKDCISPSVMKLSLAGYEILG